MTSTLRFKGDMRDPYMGNTLEVRINIRVDEDGYILGVEILSPEGIKTEARPLNPTDVQ